MNKTIRALLTGAMLLWGAHAIAQRSAPLRMYDYKSVWQKVDSLNQASLPQSARKVVQEILLRAETLQDEPQTIKAQLWLLRLNQEESASLQAIKTGEAQLAAARTPVTQALWANATAKLYQQYISENRYQLYSRTTASVQQSDDPATWDLQSLHDTIAALYLRSLHDQEALKYILTKDYDALVEPGQHTDSLRPYLYDVLVFDAIDYFSQEERLLTRPAYAFQLNDSSYFAPAAAFANMKLQHKDSTSLHFRALQLYQQILQKKIRERHPEALIDADLLRLGFVYAYSTLPDKEARYTQALTQLIRQYPEQKATAMARFTVLNRQYQHYRSLREQSTSGKSTSGIQLTAIAEQLSELIRRYPDSEGAAYAQNLLNELNQQTFMINMQLVQIPDQPILASLSYKNVARLDMTLHRLSTEDFLDEEEPETKPYRSWSQKLVNSTDLQDHRAEVQIEALPAGQYLLTMINPDAPMDTLYHYFQVSKISIVKNREQYNRSQPTQLYILDRALGTPLAQVRLDYEAGTTWKHLAQSAADGMLQAPVYGGQLDYNTTLRLISGSDTLILSERANGLIEYERNYKEDKKDRHQDFLFTDRSLYRPGQTVYFKGVRLRTDYQGTKTSVVVNDKVTVRFNDVNGQNIKELQLNTNDFGSFSGSFTIPESGMTGSMQLNSGNGNISFNVEEYKRPRFAVSYDTLKSNYALNDQVTITGTAMAYAGNSISNAQVQYRVVRRTRFPYWWRARIWGLPMASGQQEIVHGTTETDASGHFSIPFTALADENIPADAQPVFQYEISADVTDLNGETRSSTTYFAAGYTGILLQLELPQQSTPEQMRQLSVRTENLNGIFTPAPVSIKISRLRSPDRLYRERLWDAPTDFIMTEQAFHKAFPNDMYHDEWKPENRAVDRIVWEHQYTSSPDQRTVQTPKGIWEQSAYYLIELRTTDHHGKPVTEKKYVFVWNAAQPEQHDLPLLVRNDSDRYHPGQTLQQWVVPAHAQAHLLQYNSWGKQFSPTIRKAIRQPISSSDQGGAFTSWAYVYQNRLYTSAQPINVPWDKKDLQLSWATHRDKLQPGAQEEWTLTISGPQKDKVSAELLAGLYDASLDALQPHNWQWSSLLSHRYYYNGWSSIAFEQRISDRSAYTPGQDIAYDKTYPRLLPYIYDLFDRYYSPRALSGAAPGVMVSDKASVRYKREDVNSMESVTVYAQREAPAPEAAQNAATAPDKETEQPATMPTRSNLQETAFFMPQLQTDQKGNVVLKFTMPEALTEWRFMAFAHTPDWATGYLEGKVKTQKELMVTPNVPRFFRQGDELTISTKISNLSDRELTGTASVSFVNALTGQPLDKAFQQRNATQSFHVAAGANVPVNFSLSVPQSVYEPVTVRIVAQAGNFSDGESHTIPVVTNRMLVTETLPMPVHGEGTTHFTLDKLLQSAQSNSLVHKGLTIEYTANPAWYAVQALPYLMEYPYECAEQTFNRFYANALAGHIVTQTPKIKTIFDQWSTKDTAALLSQLSKNQELKSALLEETPWVMEAQDEQEQKRNIAQLFATHKMATALTKNLKKLRDMQNNDGSFSWFDGMRADRYISQYILTGMAKLEQLQIAAVQDKSARQLIDKGLQYLDQAIVKDYEAIPQDKLKENHLSAMQVQYLFLRSAYPAVKMTAATQKAYDYYRAQSKQHWTGQNNYMQGMIALTLYRHKDLTTSKAIMASLSERAIRNPETGMYWKPDRGYWWYNAPVETQALLIQAYKEILNDQASVDQMNIWLLKQKQTQNWRTTTATADACYALLSGNASWLQNEPEVTITAGDKTISPETREAGTGYLKQSIPGTEVNAGMGKLSITVKNSAAAPKAIGWGAAYWQYFDNMDRISAAAGTDMPLRLEQQLFLSRNTDRGPVLTPITADSPIRIGDKVTVRIIIRADRSMDYVHLKCMRAAGFEPTNVLSGYRYGGGLGYYESTRDLASNFFIDHLPKGTHVFEYQVIANQRGRFSNGITTIQSMYAPEYSSHTKGIQVSIQ